MTQIGFVGLGRMGGNMVHRILRDSDHEVVAFARSEEGIREAEANGATGARSLRELVRRLEPPRMVWVMIPAGDPTEQTVAQLARLMERGDTIIDGGNSRWTDDKRRARELGKAGIAYVDVGVSGGVWGRANGYALMAGGSKDDVGRLQPIFDTLKPAGEFGFVHAGGVGAGHYAKMVHNGIEYGLMQAYAEGYELLAKSDIVTDVPATIKSWRSGTVIQSWLLDLLDRALDADDDLSELRGRADDSGEGRWTLESAIDNAVPMPVISAALFARFSSRQEESPAMKVVAALRQQFGGHAVTSADGPPH